MFSCDDFETFKNAFEAILINICRRLLLNINLSIITLLNFLITQLPHKTNIAHAQTIIVWTYSIHTLAQTGA